MKEQSQRIVHERVSKEGGMLVDIEKKTISKTENKERQTAGDKCREERTRNIKKIKNVLAVKVALDSVSKIPDANDARLCKLKEAL